MMRETAKSRAENAQKGTKPPEITDSGTSESVFVTFQGAGRKLTNRSFVHRAQEAQVPVTWQVTGTLFALAGAGTLC
jgi:hypothetical protein